MYRPVCPHISAGTHAYTFSLLTNFNPRTALALAITYAGWGHIMLMMLIASFFYITPRVILALLFGTLLLPAKPVLWKPFNRSWWVSGNFF